MSRCWNYLQPRKSPENSRKVFVCEGTTESSKRRRRRTRRDDIDFSGLCGFGGNGKHGCRLVLVMYFVEDEKIARDLQRSLDTDRTCLEATGKGHLKLTDPRLEYQDPTPNIHELFALLDRRYFWGELGMVQVKWSWRMTKFAGLCYYQGKSGLCCIKLSAPLLSLRPRKDLVETLLHEMIHAYLFVTEDEIDREDHGPKFRKHLRRINKEAGTDITVYHTFEDEIAYYQKHIWRCDGKCRDKRPLFGFVRKTTSKPPGPGESWWREHQKNCGGAFIKVSEPQKHCKRKVKLDKDKAEKNTSETRDVQDFLPLEGREILPTVSFKESSPDAKTMKTIPDPSDLHNRPGIEEQRPRTPGQTHVIKPETEDERLGERKAMSGEEEDKNEYLRVRATVRNVWASKYLSPSKTGQRPGSPNLCPPITIEMRRREIKCPLCFAPFSETLIDEHVEECLSKVKCVQIVNETVRVKGPKQGRSPTHEENRSKRKLVPCPVCRRILHVKDLSEHLEACLNFNFEDTAKGDGTGCDRVPCPCCLKWVLEKSINDHVGECLAQALEGSPKCD